MGVAHFDKISEDVVVTDLERRNTCRLALSLLNLLQYVFAMQSDTPQIVQFGTDAVGDYASLLNLIIGGIGVNFPFEFYAHLLQYVDLLCQPVKIPVVGRFENCFEQFDRPE